MTTTLQFEKSSDVPHLSLLSWNKEDQSEGSENIDYIAMHKERFPEVEDRLTRGQLEEKVAMLVADYIEDNSDMSLVMEIAVTYEMLGKLSSAYYYYFWAYEMSGKNETLGAKLDTLRQKLSEAEA